MLTARTRTLSFANVQWLTRTALFARPSFSTVARRQTPNHYEVLGVSRSATGDEIKAAYRKLAKELHPDANKTPGADKKFAAVNGAYQVLKDDAKRRLYDRGGDDAVSRGSEQQTYVTPGQDVKTDVVLSFMEAAKGCEKEVQYTAPAKCSTCDGTGAKPGSKAKTCPGCRGAGVQRMYVMNYAVEMPCQRCGGARTVIDQPCAPCRGHGMVETPRTRKVVVPPGVDSGQRMRVQFEGGRSKDGGPPGDLYIDFDVAPHSVFQRDGHDIHMRLPLSMVDACLGSVIKVPTLESEVEVTVPSGTQPADRHVLRRKGIPVGNSSRRGDLFIHFDVAIPKKLTAKQREILQSLQAELGDRSPVGTAGVVEGAPKGTFSTLKNAAAWITGKDKKADKSEQKNDSSKAPSDS